MLIISIKEQSLDVRNDWFKLTNRSFGKKSLKLRKGASGKQDITGKTNEWNRDGGGDLLKQCGLTLEGNKRTTRKVSEIQGNKILSFDFNLKI